MACGGCAERREAIVAGVKALVSGDVAAAARQGERFATSLKVDARRLALAASHARLKRR